MAAIASTETVNFGEKTLTLAVMDDGSRRFLAAAEAPPTSILDGENTDVDTTGEPLGADTECSEVLVQAKNANTGTLFVGDVDAQTFELTAGQSITVPIDNVNKVYVKASVANQGANWIAKP